MALTLQRSTAHATCRAPRRVASVAPRRPLVLRVSATSSRDQPGSLSRRGVLAAPVVLWPLVAGVSARPVRAAEAGYKTFLGYSQAPDLYMGYGQAQDAPPLYSFDYPANWEVDIPTKTEKSTMGMDGRVVHPETRKELAYVVALGGKDYRDSVLTDAKTSLIVFAGSDPDMRQALTDGTVKQSKVKVNGSDLYVYDIASNRRRYLSSIGKKGDTVFALVVTAPIAAFERDAAGLQHIQDSFRLL
ncbi:thylakoid lumenal protein [Scenedesmus sp. PABB004]|nr:thylakoid lumenal protein [Scenedesmus sp. PABB004]